MSATDLAKRLQAIPIGEPMDWQKIRQEIQLEANKPCTTEDRIVLLRLSILTLDQVEREIVANSPENLEAFKKARLSDYRLLLTKEALVGEHVCADTLYAITEREIAAGRMSAEDDLRLVAVKGVLEPHLSRDEMVAMQKKETSWRRIFGWLFRR